MTNVNIALAPTGLCTSVKISDRAKELLPNWQTLKFRTQLSQHMMVGDEFQFADHPDSPVLVVTKRRWVQSYETAELTIWLDAPLP